MDWLLLCFLVTVILLFVMLMARTKKQQKHTRNKVTEPASVLIVVGSGGHTSEILKLVKVMGYHYSPRYYVIADTDTISEHKVREVETERENSGRNCEYKLFIIPRSREVKQSYWTSILTTLRALAFSVPLVFKLRPEVGHHVAPGFLHMQVSHVLGRTCDPAFYPGENLAVVNKFLSADLMQRPRHLYTYLLCRLALEVAMDPENIHCLHRKLLPSDFPVPIWQALVPLFRQFLCAVARTGSEIPKGTVLG